MAPEPEVIAAVAIQLINLGSASVIASAESTGAVASMAAQQVSEAAMAAVSSPEGGVSATGVSVAAASSSASGSVMGAVAMSKVGLAAGGNEWQPGLLEVQLGGRVSDLLGLGDAVFPAILSTFCLRFDEEKEALRRRKHSQVDFRSSPELRERALSSQSSSPTSRIS